MKLDLKDRFINMMKFKDADDSEEFDEEFEGYEEEYDEEIAEGEETYEEESDYEEEAEEAVVKKPLFSFRRKSKNSYDEEEEYEAGEEADNTIIPFLTKQEEGETVRVIKPQEFNEAQIVAEFLKEGKTIVVNLEGIEISQAQRIIDFIGGASFAVNGSLKAISNNIFIVAPGNIEVSGDLRDEIVGENIISPELGKF